MSLRICPNCHSELGNFDHYFCSKCGSVLPKELINDQVEVTVKNYKSVDSTKVDKFPVNLNLESATKYFHHKSVIALIFVVVLAIILLGFESLFPLVIPRLKSTSPVVTIPSAVAESSQSTQSGQLDLPLSGASQKFDMTALNEYVPAESDLYVYGNNLGTFISGISETNVYSELFSKMPDILNKPFVLFSIKNGKDEDWGLVVNYSNNSILTTILTAGLKDFGQFKFDENYLIAGSNDFVINSALSAKKKDSLNIELSPTYVKAQYGLSKQGLGEVIFMNQTGKKVLSDAKNYKIGSTLQNTIDAILKTGYNEVVIN